MISTAKAAPVSDPKQPTRKSLRPRPGRPTLSNEELLDKARDLFLEQGFERTSIDAIAAAAGMAKRTIYQRYGDKETLFLASLQHTIDEWVVPVEQLRAAESEDLEQTLLTVGRILVNNIMKPAGLRLLRITNAESARVPEIGAYTYQRGTERTIDYLADLFHRRLTTSGAGIQDWNEAAIAFLYLVVGGPPTMTVWGMALDDETIDKHTCYCVRLFLYGLLPREDAPPRKDGFRQDTPQLESAGLSAPAAEVIFRDEPRSLRELQDENRRLKKLLLASMLETASLKELRDGH